MNKVKKVILLLGVAFTAWYVHGGSWLAPSADNNSAKETRHLESFSGVRAGGNLRVSVSLADTYQLEIYAPESLHDSILTEIHGDTLHISRSSKRRVFFQRPPKANIEVEVQLPQVNSLHSTGSSSLTLVTPLQQNQLILRSSGSSELHATATVKELYATSSGSSDIHVRGHADRAHITTSGSSELHGKELTCHVASLQLSGSSDMRMTVLRELDARLSGSSELLLHGEPVTRYTATGSARIRRLH